MENPSKQKRNKSLSPAGRQAERDAAQAAALAELESVRSERRARSAQLRKLRLEKEEE